MPALLDLGAGVSVLNSAAARALQLAAVRAGRTEAISGAIGSSSVTARLGTHTVRTSGVSWHNEVFLIADLEIFSTLESTDRPLAILGSGLFSQRDLILDLARDRLLIRSGMDEIES